VAVIGTITSDFLAPGVSRNNRYYTPEVCAKAVKRLQERLADPDALPVQMLSYHGAGDQTREVAARWMTAEWDEDAQLATASGYLVGTQAGRDIAELTTPGPDGRRTVDSVSINGWWLGPTRQVEIDGVMCETGDDLEINTIDITKSPGVLKARIRAAAAEAQETAPDDGPLRTPITESVEVTVMPDIPGRPSPADMPPKKPGEPAAKPAAAEVAPDGPAGTEGGTQEQDATPGADATETAEAATEAAPNPLAETIAALREAHVRIGGWQGPIDIDLDAWGISNDDVSAAAVQLGAAFDAALKVLDPDNDGDFDLPDGTDVDTCAGCDGLLPAGAAYCPSCGAAVVAAESADHTEKEPVMPDQKPATETKPAEGAPAEGAAKEAAATTTTEAAATEDAPADAPAATDAPADGATAPAAGMSLLPGDVEAIATSLHSKLTAAAPAESAQVDVAKVVGEAVAKAQAETAEAVRKELRAELIEKFGSPRRKGLVEAAEKDAPETPLHKMSPEEFTRHAAGAWDAVIGVPGGE